MDKDTLREYARQFCGQDCGIIHCEMMNGKHPEIMIGGDTVSIMWLIDGVINRLSEISGVPFEETAMTILSLTELGYDNVQNVRKKEKPRYYVSEDWQERAKKDIEKDVKREVASESITLALNLAEMEKRNTSLNNQLVDLKKEYTKNLKTKDEQIKALTKECQALEHRMKEMEQHTLLPREDEEM